MHKPSSFDRSPEVEKANRRAHRGRPYRAVRVVGGRVREDLDVPAAAVVVPAQSDQGELVVPVELNRHGGIVPRRGDREDLARRVLDVENDLGRGLRVDGRHVERRAGRGTTGGAQEHRDQGRPAEGFRAAERRAHAPDVSRKPPFLSTAGGAPMRLDVRAHDLGSPRLTRHRRRSRWNRQRKSGARGQRSRP